jgi:anti-sigma B factor antagonist
MINKEEREICVIPLSGKLDAYSSREMEATFNAVVDTGNIRVVVDATNLEYISSAGLRVLLSALKKVKKQQGDIKLACLSPQVKTVFDIAGFNQLFFIAETVEAAKHSFQ